MRNKISITLAMLLIAGSIGAQTAEVADNGPGLTSILVGVNGILLIVAVFLLLTLSNAVQKLKAGSDGKEHLSWWDKFAALKSEKTEQELTLDENFDGITELDNPTPPWFNFIFYTTIIVGILYILHYHVLKSGSLQDAEYVEEVEIAKAKTAAYLAKAGNLIDESNVTLLTEKSEIEAGAKLYQEKCAVCHVNDGGGAVGPNLTDAYWLHGGDIQSIFKTIKYGVPAKGMIAWQNSFNGKQMQQLASFVKSLQGTTPAKPKEPQGELMQEGGAAAPVDSAAAKATALK
jgi:cytochrome c oxidase cbb3-type subunit III